MIEEIQDFQQRLQLLEEALLDGVSGDTVELGLEHDDPLGAIEVGVSVLIEALRARISQAETLNRELDERVEARTRELQQRLDELAEQHELISRQRSAIERLSTPILQLWSQIIALPIIGVVDSERAADLTETLLATVARDEVRYVILDLTGVEVIDSRTAAHLFEMIRATQLLGSNCVLTGIQPVVAKTMVTLGIDLGAMRICRNLEAGLRDCLLDMTRSPGDET